MILLSTEPNVAMDAKLLSRLQAQCSRREYCIRDIRQKAIKALEGDTAGAEAGGLERSGTSAQARAEEIVASLVADGFVDERRYAAAFARDKSSLAGWGPIKIRQMLRAKGIPDETIREALGDIDPERADDKLRRLLDAKRRTLEGDPAMKLKLIRFALSRGYDYDAVEKALKESQ